MRKLIKFFKSIFLISIWLVLFSLITSLTLDYWKDIHLQFIYLKFVKVFHYEFWFKLEDLLFGFDLGFYLEELFRFITFEIPIETIKFIPIYIIIKSIWSKNKKRY